MILVDSSVWIDLTRDRSTPQIAKLDAIAADGGVIGVGDLMRAEVLRGACDGAEFARVGALLDGFAQVRIGSHAVATEAARNYRALRELGITVRGTIDCLIATRCIVDGHALLFADRDFAPFVTHLGLRDAMA